VIYPELVSARRDVTPIEYGIIDNLDAIAAITQGEQAVT
jgi:hypothetical protein